MRLHLTPFALRRGPPSPLRYCTYSGQWSNALFRGSDTVRCDDTSSLYYALHARGADFSTSSSQTHQHLMRSSVLTLSLLLCTLLPAGVGNPQEPKQHVDTIPVPMEPPRGSGGDAVPTVTGDAQIVNPLNPFNDPPPPPQQQQPAAAADFFAGGSPPAAASSGLPLADGSSGVSAVAAAAPLPLPPKSNSSSSFRLPPAPPSTHSSARGEALLQSLSSPGRPFAAPTRSAPSTPRCVSCCCCCCCSPPAAAAAAARRNLRTQMKYTSCYHSTAPRSFPLLAACCAGAMTVRKRPQRARHAPASRGARRSTSSPTPRSRRRRAMRTPLGRNVRLRLEGLRRRAVP